MNKLWSQDPRTVLQPGESFSLATFDRGSTPGFTGKKKDAFAHIAERAKLLSQLQERLFAQGKAGSTRNVLVVVQGLDTAGKGGIARHVMGLIDPQGVALRSFGVPTPEEREHHYLWRIENALPGPGKIGLFDRSHYEDVLVARVNNIVPKEVWSQRFDEINQWERKLVESGTVILKFALMVSYDEQAKRLMERIDRPDKRWKYSPGDIDTRHNWDAYQEAYQDVFKLTSTDYAPWHVVPADKKWYPRLAVTEILTRALAELDMSWPEPAWQASVERQRLAPTMSAEALQDSLAETSATVTQAIDEIIAVDTEMAKLRAQPASAQERKTALAAVAAQRSSLEADLAATLADKKQLAKK